MAVVATGFVSDATSKSVAGERTSLLASSKDPLLAKEARSGALSALSIFPGLFSYTKVPKDFRALSSLFRVTAIEAAGKARWLMASWRTENALEKI
jgi:hypothetical protein